MVRTTNIENQVRTICSVCNSKKSNSSKLHQYPCNVRAYKNDVFNVWQCSQCQTIHCYEIVDLDYYYNQYPTKRDKMTDFRKIGFKKQLKRLKKSGLQKHHNVLDYGCGKGLLVDYLKEQGYANTIGYDPYNEQMKQARDQLQEQTFDFIILQDVIEHVENPISLLQQLSDYLKPNGLCFIGTPFSDIINMSSPESKNAIHAPYHLHLYSTQVLKQLAEKVKWQAIKLYKTAYFETPHLGLNMPFGNLFQNHFDGTLDVFLDDITTIEGLKILFKSPKHFFYGVFGYWIKPSPYRCYVFKKPSSLDQ